MTAPDRCRCGHALGGHYADGRCTACDCNAAVRKERRALAGKLARVFRREEVPAS